MERTRRTALRAGGLVAATSLTGCLLGWGGGCVHSASFRMTEATPADIAQAYATPVAELEPLDSQLTRAAVQGEQPTVTTASEELDLGLDGQLVAVEDRYYRLSTSLTATSERTGYRLTVKTSNAIRTAATPAETITFEDLPAPDRRVLLLGFLNEIAPKFRAGERTPEDVSFERSATVVYPSDDAEEASVLVPEPEYEYVSFRNLTLRVEVAGTTSAVTARTFAVTAEQMADSTRAFVRAMKTKQRVNLDERSLSAKQRQILEKAITKEYGYDACLDETPSPAFRKLMETIFGVEEELDSYYSGQPRLVRYDGTWYLASYSVAVA